MDNKIKRIEIFEDTERAIKENSTLRNSVEDTISRTMLYTENITSSTPKYDKPCVVSVSKKRSFAAAEAYKKEHPNDMVCVLNFASATNPGGGVKKGSSAQEESLCRCSTLYPALSTKELYDSFYNYHRNADSVLYSDACIYTPDIIVFKTDTNEPEMKEEKDWFKADIITCAAPNLRPIPSNEMNPGPGKAAKITQKELLILHKKRTEQILNVAALNRVDALILGAFGCGAFCNPPEIVARAFKESLEIYKNNFKYVEFAVYCKPTETLNYDVFDRHFRNFK